MMKSFMSLVLLSLLCTIQMMSGEALQCYTCISTNDEECNQQGSEQCPGQSNACLVIRGQSSGIMKSCSYRSFCDRAQRESSQTPGISIHCCYSNNCNAKGLGSRNILYTSYFSLFFSAILWNLFFNLK